MHIDWSAAATAIVTLLVFVLTNRSEIKKRHAENMKKWDDLQRGLVDYPLHEHAEKDGTLTVAGIRIRRDRRWGDD